jgi:hypothetical protein
MSYGDHEITTAYCEEISASYLSRYYSNEVQYYFRQQGPKFHVLHTR